LLYHIFYISKKNIMASISQIAEQGSETNLRVKDTLLKVLEGEVVELAVAMRNSEVEGGSFSRSSGSYHSRCGHQFSRTSPTRAASEPFFIDKNNVDIENAYSTFLEQLEHSNI
jgi:hypothetical protein